MLSQPTLIFVVFVFFCIKEAPGTPIASSEIFISSSWFVLIFLTYNLGIASDFSPLKIYSSRKSRPPITVSFLAGIKISNLSIWSTLHFKIL